MPPATSLSTLAYVNTECLEGNDGLTGRQGLYIRQGDGTTSLVKQVSTLSVLRVLGLCSVFGTNRFGFGSVAAGAFQRLGVSPDGETVVFELTPEFSILPLRLAEEDVGIFAVSSDGTGLRKLGPPSAQPSFTFPPGDLAGIRNSDPFFAFSPDGHTVVFTDLGPGPNGESATQVVALDLRNGGRTNLTALPNGPSPIGFPDAPGTCCPRFVADEKVVFATTADADRRHPGGLVVQYIVDLVGGPPIPLTDRPPPGIAVLPIFGIAGAPERGVSLYLLVGQPSNTFPPGTPILPGFPEVFSREPLREQRLTTFRRADTLGPLLGNDGQTVFFVSSADPHGDNPTESCQVFSTNLASGGTQQITRFAEGDGKSVAGCYFNGRPGCSSLFLFQDATSDRLVFYSSCDLLGSNPNGGQIYAMRPDGSQLQQLTSARGMTREPDRSLLVELPGPFAYPIPPLENGGS